MIEYVASYMNVHLVLIKNLSLLSSIFKVLTKLNNKLWLICDILKYYIIELQLAKSLVAVSYSNKIRKI